jgi:2-dehydro-3-deoxygluconokinase
MKRFVTFGELLLSLGSSGNQRLVQAEHFTAHYVGAEANVAVSLAHFGVEAYEVSKVPAHEIGQACINALRRYGVRTGYILRGGDRLGLLYKETGASQRPTKVIYDRTHSAIRQIRPGEIDWDAIFAGKDWFHISGSSVALGPEVVEVIAPALVAAKRGGLTVSCDCNYRSKLWSMEQAGEVLSLLLRNIDVLICGRDDPHRIFGIPSQALDGLAGPARDQRAAELMQERFHLDCVAMTFREGISASVNGLSAMLCRSGKAYFAPRYEMQIVDRVGGGDAFAAGLIFGLLSEFESQRVIDFATAAACLKHSIPGDCNLVSREEVEQLLAGGESGRVQR